MHSNWEAPQNYRVRSVAVLGGGVLGRRIGKSGGGLEVSNANSLT